MAGLRQTEFNMVNEYGFSYTYRVGVSALTALFARLDRVLAGPRHKGLVVESKVLKDAPSQTDGTTIAISDKVMADAVSRRGLELMAAFGLNYHELAHVLFTPKFNQPTVQWLRSDSLLHMAFNILEDNRIEHMIRQLYPQMTHYFLGAIYKFYYNVSRSEFKANWHVYSLVNERRYIPKEDRADSRAVMVGVIGEQLTQDVERITAEYVRMVNITSLDFLTDQQKKLIQDLRDIFAKFLPSHPVKMKNICLDEASATGGSQKKKTLVKVEPYEDIDADADDGSGGEGGKDGEKEEGDGDGEGGGENGEGSGKSKNRQRGWSPVGSATRNALNDALHGSVELQRDMQMVQTAVEKAEFLLTPLDKRHLRTEPVTAEMRKQRDTFVREMQKVQDKVDPGWERYEASGRLNIDRAMRNDDPLTVFDNWAEDQSEQLQIEAKMLADVSGSMAGGLIQQASKAFWVIASALDKVDAQVDQIAYTDQSFQIKPRGIKEKEHTYTRLPALGGTHPRVAIAKSLFEFQNSERKHKLFLMYTDGGWNSSKDDADIQMMNDLGVTTVMIYLDDGKDYGYKLSGSDLDSYRHKCEHFYTVKTGGELSDIARKIVTAMLNKAAAAVGR